MYLSILQACFHLGGGGGNLGVILVRVCDPVFWKLPQSYTWPSKNMTYSYTLLYTMLTYLYVHDLFATYTQNLHTNITILFQFGSLSWISVQTYAHLNRDVKMEPFKYQSRKNGSVMYSFLGRKGLIVYPAALKKGAIRAAHPYHVIYRELPPSPRGLHTPGWKSSRGRTKQRQSFAFFHQLTTRLSQHSDMEYEIRIHGLPGLLLERIGFKMVLNSDV